MLIEKTKRPTLTLSQKTDPGEYCVRLSSELKRMGGNIIVWEYFSNRLARIFNLDPSFMYKIICASVKRGQTVHFGNYTKDVALTMIHYADKYVQDQHPAAILSFSAVRL